MSQLTKHLQPDEKVLWSGKPILILFIFSGLIVIPVIGVVSLIFATFFGAIRPLNGSKHLLNHSAN